MFKRHSTGHWTIFGHQTHYNLFSGSGPLQFILSYSTHGSQETASWIPRRASCSRPQPAAFFQELWSPPVHRVLVSNQDLNYIVGIHGIQGAWQGR